MCGKRFLPLHALGFTADKGFPGGGGGGMGKPKNMTFMGFRSKSDASGGINERSKAPSLSGILKNRGNKKNKQNRKINNKED